MRNILVLGANQVDRVFLGYELPTDIVDVEYYSYRAYNLVKGNTIIEVEHLRDCDAFELLLRSLGSISQIIILASPKENEVYVKYCSYFKSLWSAITLFVTDPTYDNYETKYIDDETMVKYIQTAEIYYYDDNNTLISMIMGYDNSLKIINTNEVITEDIYLQVIDDLQNGMIRNKLCSKQYVSHKSIPRSNCNIFLGLNITWFILVVLFIIGNMSTNKFLDFIILAICLVSYSIVIGLFYLIKHDLKSRVRHTSFRYVKYGIPREFQLKLYKTDEIEYGLITVSNIKYSTGELFYKGYMRGNIFGRCKFYDEKGSVIFAKLI